MICGGGVVLVVCFYHALQPGRFFGSVVSCGIVGGGPLCCIDDRFEVQYCGPNYLFAMEMIVLDVSRVG